MRVLWQPLALLDLARLHDFLSPVSPHAAKATLAQLKKAPRLLGSQPYIGTPLTEFAPRDVRRLIVGKYELRYEVGDKAIHVLRLWHTREDR